MLLLMCHNLAVLAGPAREIAGDVNLRFSVKHSLYLCWDNTKQIPRRYHLVSCLQLCSHAAATNTQNGFGCNGMTCLPLRQVLG